MSIEKIKEDIIAMSKEFDEKDGCVTCEISIQYQEIDEFSEFVIKNTNIKLGKWIFYECETCTKLYGKDYIHASIESADSIKWIDKSKLI